MSKIKLSLKYCLIFILAISLIAIFAIKGSTDTLAKKLDKEEVILIQSAAKGSLERDKSDKNLYKITLEKVLPYLSYVADRPNRTVGKITLEKYLKLWVPRGENSFQNSPPNAIIHTNAIANSNASRAIENSDNTKSQFFALEISAPQYDAEKGTLTYKAKALNGEGANLPETASFEHITLIIDDVCIGCWD